jgi:ribosomal protein L32
MAAPQGLSMRRFGAPRAIWEATTFIARRRHHHQLTAPTVVDGPKDGELFLAWVEQFPCPTHHRGDIVILDNLSSHKMDGVQQAIALGGATVLYLLPYSPDLSCGSRSVNCSSPSRRENAPATSPRLDR